MMDKKNALGAAESRVMGICDDCIMLYRLHPVSIVQAPACNSHLIVDNTLIHTWVLNSHYIMQQANTT